MSAIPAVRAQLERDLKKRTEDDLVGVDISYGFPKEFSFEHIVVDAPDTDDTEWVEIGTLAREDKFTIPLLIHVARPGISAEEIDQRADAILDVVYDVVDKDYMLGNVLYQPLQPALREWDNFWHGDRWITQIVLWLRCWTRSQP